jgi:hypothetical protein
MILLSVPINTPFPVTFGLSLAVVAAVGVALAIAAVRDHPRTRVYILLAGGIACGLLLAAWSAHYVLTGPSDADPIVRSAQEQDAAPIRNPYYDLYLAV